MPDGVSGWWVDRSVGRQTGEADNRRIVIEPIPLGPPLAPRHPRAQAHGVGRCEGGFFGKAKFLVAKAWIADNPFVLPRRLTRRSRTLHDPGDTLPAVSFMIVRRVRDKDPLAAAGMCGLVLKFHNIRAQPALLRPRNPSQRSQFAQLGEARSSVGLDEPRRPSWRTRIAAALPHPHSSSRAIPPYASGRTANTVTPDILCLGAISREHRTALVSRQPLP